MVNATEGTAALNLASNPTLTLNFNKLSDHPQLQNNFAMPRVQEAYGDWTDEERDPSSTESEEDSEDESGEDVQLSEPFDISQEPGSMTTGNHPNQELALRAALLSNEADGSEDFLSQPIYQRTPTTLKTMYEAGSQQDSNIRKMGRRSRIQWRRSEDVVMSSSADVYWNADEFYLDLLICRGRDVGLSALLPNVDVHHAIEFKMELTWSPRTFSPKYAHLGFDPLGAIQYIGRTHRGEDAWIAWIPHEAVGFMQDEQDVVAAGTCSGSTHMAKRHYHGAFMYFASALNDMGHRDITVWERYPDIDDREAVEDATNLR